MRDRDSGAELTDSVRTQTARRALEEVCSGRDLPALPEGYHPDFVDHVNALEYRGHEGARQSVSLYKALFPICGSWSRSR